MDTNDLRAHALALAHDACQCAEDVVDRAKAYFEFLKTGLAAPRPTPVEPIRETAPLPTQIPVAVVGDPAPPPAPGPVTNIPFTSELSPDPAPPLSALPAQLPADNAGAATMTTDTAPQPAS